MNGKLINPDESSQRMRIIMERQLKPETAHWWNEKINITSLLIKDSTISIRA
jgi:hypothetical protein